MGLLGTRARRERCAELAADDVGRRRAGNESKSRPGPPLRDLADCQFSRVVTPCSRLEDVAARRASVEVRPRRGKQIRRHCGRTPGCRWARTRIDAWIVGRRGARALQCVECEASLHRPDHRSAAIPNSRMPLAARTRASVFHVALYSRRDMSLPRTTTSPIGRSAITATAMAAFRTIRATPRSEDHAPSRDSLAGSAACAGPCPRATTGAETCSTATAAAERAPNGTNAAA